MTSWTQGLGAIGHTVHFDDTFQGLPFLTFDVRRRVEKGQWYHIVIRVQNTIMGFCKDISLASQALVLLRD